MVILLMMLCYDGQISMCVCVCASVLGELNLVVFDESTPLLSLVLKRCEKKFFFLKFQKKTDDDDNHNDEIQFYLPLLFGQKKI